MNEQGKHNKWGLMESMEWLQDPTEDRSDLAPFSIMSHDLTGGGEGWEQSGVCFKLDHAIHEAGYHMRLPGRAVVVDTATLIDWVRANGLPIENIEEVGPILGEGNQEQTHRDRGKRS